MNRERRRFLAGAAGLGVLLSPKISFAGLFHGRRRQPVQCVRPPSPCCQVATCPQIKPHGSFIPWHKHILLYPFMHRITLYGDGLACAGRLEIFVEDTLQYQHGVRWEVICRHCVMHGGGGPNGDLLMFWAVAHRIREGATAGVGGAVGNLLIGVTAANQPDAYWPQNPVVYPQFGN
jgi:hypothetical protein